MKREAQKETAYRFCLPDESVRSCMTADREVNQSFRISGHILIFKFLSDCYHIIYLHRGNLMLIWFSTYSKGYTLKGRVHKGAVWSISLLCYETTFILSS